MHELEVKGSGKYGIFHSNFYIKPAQNITKRIMLPEKNNTVNLSINSLPQQADLYINGDFIGKTPQEKITLSSGTQNITIQKNGFREYFVKKDFSSEQSYSLLYTLIPKEKYE
jgi:hypothetical protein